MYSTKWLILTESNMPLKILHTSKLYIVLRKHLSNVFSKSCIADICIWTIIRTLTIITNSVSHSWGSSSNIKHDITLLLSIDKMKRISRLLILFTAALLVLAWMLQVQVKCSGLMSWVITQLWLSMSCFMLLEEDMNTPERTGTNMSGSIGTTLYQVNLHTCTPPTCMNPSPSNPCFMLLDKCNVKGIQSCSGMGVHA